MNVTYNRKNRVCQVIIGNLVIVGLVKNTGGL